MKNRSVLWIFILATISILFISFETRSVTSNNGVIGDVKYSILPPKDFDKVNGPGWVLLDGQAVQQSWSLYSDVLKFHSSSDVSDPLREIVNNLPNGNGVFIRGMNNGREPLTGDPEGNRSLGKYQSDTFLKHDHGGGNHNHVWTNSSLTIDSWASQVVRGGSGSISIGTPNSGNIINPEGGLETRPRNIALYVYIKVNQ